MSSRTYTLWNVILRSIFLTGIIKMYVFSYIKLFTYNFVRNHA